MEVLRDVRYDINKKVRGGPPRMVGLVHDINNNDT